MTVIWIRTAAREGEGGQLFQNTFSERYVRVKYNLETENIVSEVIPRVPL